MARSPSCLKLGLGVKEIRVAAGTGADVMAGEAGAVGSANAAAAAVLTVRGLK